MMAMHPSEVGRSADDREGYEVFAFRYATSQRERSRDFYRYERYGEEDGPSQMDFYFWLARNEERTIVIDSGFKASHGERWGWRQERHPAELLETVGVEARDVHDVVVTHMHGDHIGNLDLFPNATMCVSRREFGFWTGPMGTRPMFAWLSHPDDIQFMKELHAQGRVRLVDDEYESHPGVRLIHVGGHSRGQMMVEIESSHGHDVVIASDAIHYYEEMERDRPFTSFVDLEEMYRAYELLRGLEGQADKAIVAGHDPMVLERFERVHGDCADLGKPLTKHGDRRSKK